MRELVVGISHLKSQFAKLEIIVRKILDVKYWWPTMHKDAFQYCKACDNYQRIGNFIQSSW
jgi:hypothetical protein